MTASQAGPPKRDGEDLVPSLPNLREELVRAPGRVCLVVGEQAASRQLLQNLAELEGVEAVSIGRLLTASERPIRFDDLQTLIGDASFLVDLDILFWPEAQSNALQLLRALSRKAPRFAHWPGALAGRRLTYSERGRKDFFEAAIDDAVVVRPRVVRFPDEVPYEVERIPA